MDNKKNTTLDQTTLQTQQKKQSNQRAYLWFTYLFAAFFLIPACYQLYPTLKAGAKYLQSATWTPVPAMILSSDMTYGYVESTQVYGVKGRYQYQWQGKTYESTQVSLHRGRDNIDRFAKDAYRKMHHANRRNEALTAWVNPLNPNEAVLFRTFRWGKLVFSALIFGTFGVIGLGALAVSISEHRNLRFKRRTMQRYPNQPWRWERRWQHVWGSHDPKPRFQAGYIPHDSRSHLIGALAGAVILSCMMLPMIWIIPRELKKDNYWVLLSIIGIVFALAVVYGFIKKLNAWRKERQIVFLLESVANEPIWLGDKLMGKVLIPESLNIKYLNAKLSHHTSIRVKTDDGEENKRVDIWQTKKTVTAYNYADGQYEFDVVIPLPKLSDENGAEEIKETSWQGEEYPYEWELIVTEPTYDLEMTFKVPVFSRR